MAHRMVKRPAISVIVITRDAEAHIVRALESVLDQGFNDVQVVVADRGSRDRTVSICQRVAERDIRLDVLELGLMEYAPALDAAFEAARGRYLMVLGQADWLAPASLEHLLHAVTEYKLQLAIPIFSFDEGAETGNPISHRLRFTLAPTASAEEFREEAHRFVADGVLGSLRGLLIDGDYAALRGIRMKVCGTELSYLKRYLSEVERVASVDGVVFHLARRDFQRSFDMALYDCCERKHEMLLDLARVWHRERDERLLIAIHRLHLHEVISCIEGVCAMRGISTIERNDRVRDMISTASIRTTLAELEGSSREFGLMYAAMVRGSVQACCLNARLASLARFSHVPFGPQCGLELSYA